MHDDHASNEWFPEYESGLRLLENEKSDLYGPFSRKPLKCSVFCRDKQLIINIFYSSGSSIPQSRSSSHTHTPCYKLTDWSNWAKRMTIALFQLLKYGMCWFWLFTCLNLLSLQVKFNRQNNYCSGWCIYCMDKLCRHTSTHLCDLQKLFRLGLAQTLVEASTDDVAENLSRFGQLRGCRVEYLLKHIIYGTNMFVNDYIFNRDKCSYEKRCATECQQKWWSSLKMFC